MAGGFLSNLFTNYIASFLPGSNDMIGVVCTVWFFAALYIAHWAWNRIKAARVNGTLRGGKVILPIALMSISMIGLLCGSIWLAKTVSEAVAQESHQPSGAPLVQPQAPSVSIGSGGIRCRNSSSMVVEQSFIVGGSIDFDSCPNSAAKGNTVINNGNSNGDRVFGPPPKLGEPPKAVREAVYRGYRVYYVKGSRLRGGLRVKPCYIFDIDGTLADLTHRLHFVRGNGKPDWRAFFAAVSADEPIRHILELARDLAVSGKPIVYVSGRSDECREDTEGWLTVNNAPKGPVYMRKQGDHRPDNIIKIELLEQVRYAGYEPAMVFDDRDQVVKAWREKGIPCAQVSEGFF
jgi:hypothetical protein